jgi:2-dehydropantoate 2-reductase
MPINNIVIVGLGGVGGYFGGKIAFFNQTCKPENKKNVVFVARSNHLKEIQKSGLILNMNDGQQIRCLPTRATDRFADIPKADLIILAMKVYDLENILTQIKKVLKKDTIILPLLNGVDIYERIRRKIDHSIVFPGCVYINSSIVSPGIVAQHGKNGRLILGKDPKHENFYSEELIELFKASQIDYFWSEHILTSIWEKYLLVCPLALTTAAYNKTIVEVLSSSRLADDVRGLMTEITLLAYKKGISFEDGYTDKLIANSLKMPADAKTSYQRDIEKKGVINEGEIYAGTLIRLANEFNIDIPVTKKLHQVIKERIEYQMLEQ